MLPESSWVKLACMWEPHRVVDVSLSVLPNRSRGRPFLRWDGKLAAFSRAIFRCEWFNVASNDDWARQMDLYFRWCGVTPIPMRVPLEGPILSRGCFKHNVLHVPFFQVQNDNWW